MVVVLSIRLSGAFRYGLVRDPCAAAVSSLLRISARFSGFITRERGDVRHLTRAHCDRRHPSASACGHVQTDAVIVRLRMRPLTRSAIELGRRQSAAPLFPHHPLPNHLYPDEEEIVALGHSAAKQQLPDQNILPGCTFGGESILHIGRNAPRRVVVAGPRRAGSVRRPVADTNIAIYAATSRMRLWGYSRGHRAGSRP